MREWMNKTFLPEPRTELTLMRNTARSQSAVTGLLTGRDFMAARRHVTGDFVVIPKVALKSDEPLMLDGMRFDELQRGFDLPVYAHD